MILAALPYAPGAEIDLSEPGGRVRGLARDVLRERFRPGVAASAFSASAPDLDDGLIAGLVMYGWILGHSARIHPDPAERAWAEEELAWWIPRVRAALGR